MKEALEVEAALCLALEALEKMEARFGDTTFRHEIQPSTYGCHHISETCPLCEGLVTGWKAVRAANQAITAIKEALVQLEQEYQFGVYSAEDLDKAWKSGYDNCKAQSLWTLEDVKKAWKRGYAAAKKEALSQPEQEPDLSMREPSAIRDRLIRAGWTPPAQPEQEPAAKVDSRFDSQVVWYLDQLPKDGTKLYTHPPVPTAQPKPLTDEKISLIAHNTDTCDWNDLNFKECWHKGFKAGFREAEIEHNIKR